MEQQLADSVCTDMSIPDGKVRLFVESDYADLCAWWDGHNALRVPLDRLPMGPGFGLIAPGLGAVFLYETGTPVAFIGNMVSNPRADKREVHAALDRLVYDLLWLARERGISRVEGNTELMPVARRARNHGFLVKRGAYLSIEAYDQLG